MNINEIENEFPIDKNIIYLNHAAVAPWPLRTSLAINKFAEENNHFGATHYPNWVITEQQTKNQLRELINAPSSDDIALLKNTSEALSLVAYGLDWQAGDNIVSSDQEFPSNRIVWESLKNKGVEFRQTSLNDLSPNNSSAEDALIANINDKTRLLTISSVQFATGLSMDLNKLGKYCNEHNVLFCVDAIQSIGALQFDVQAMQADFVMADAHKWMLAPEGIALFYCKADKRDSLQLNQFGWHMIENHLDYTTKEWQVAQSARRFECGSPNTLGTVALNASLSLLLELGMDTIEKQLLNKTRYLIEAIDALENYEILSSRKHYAGIVVFRHKSIDSATLFQFLKSNNVICAERGGGIRFSPHFYTPEDTMDRAIALLSSYNK